MLRVLDLFSGIGGFSLGLERTGGFSTVAFCEIDPYCRAVLRKHWPGVPIFEDVRILNKETLAHDSEYRWGAWREGGSDSGGSREFQLALPDVICGGFPCQDISFAGKGAGIEGERSGLWSEFARLIGELRPRYAIVENVSALLGRGLSRVLGDLAEIGYDSEWHCIPASYVGAPHRRDRVWIVAYTEKLQRHGSGILRGSDSECARTLPEPGNGGAAENVADADTNRLETVSNDGILRMETNSTRFARHISPSGLQGDEWWFTEPDVGRVANGVPSRLDRLRSLGNAVVPQVVEIIGRAILEAEAA